MQRVNFASVTIDGKIVGRIGPGFLVLAGYGKGDKMEAVSKLVEKCLNLRVFEDDQNKMNKSILDTNGELLVISQFTLYANCTKGRRPSFDRSMPPDEAERFYTATFDEFKKSGLIVEKGVFGAKMIIDLENNGPVTIMLDDKEND